MSNSQSSLTEPILHKVREDAKLTKSENPYDSIFNWNEQSPFLGVKVDFGYVFMNEPVGKKVDERNYGFYWMYICDQPDAPVLITTIGGPGSCVLTKAFGRFNPQDIDPVKHCLIRNEDSIANRYHLIYLESPVGSGLSYCHKNTQVSKYDTIGNNAVQILKAIINNNPNLNLQSCDFFFNGDSFCGIQLPVIIKALKKEHKIKFCGLILEAPFFSYKQINSYNHQKEKQDELKLWNGGCHKCSSLYCMCIFKCLRDCGCQSFYLFDKLRLSPWVCGSKWIYTKTETDKFYPKSKKSYKYYKHNPANLTQNDCLEEEILCRPEIQYFITSEKFHKLIGAKTKIKAVDRSEYVKIQDGKDASFDSNSIMDDLMSTGASILQLSGEGDYIVPYEGINKNVEKYWNFEGKDDFLLKDWKREENWQSRRNKNFEWRRIQGAGHCIYVDQPEIHTEIIVKFLDKHLTFDMKGEKH